MQRKAASAVYRHEISELFSTYTFKRRKKVGSNTSEATNDAVGDGEGGAAATGDEEGPRGRRGRASGGGACESGRVGHDVEELDPTSP